MTGSAPLVVFKNAVLKTAHFGKKIFPNPASITILPTQKWAITGSNKTTFLSALAGQFTAVPASSREYPFLDKVSWPQSAISLITFYSDIKPAYLSARYESFREPEDDHLVGFLKRSFESSANASKTVEEQQEILNTVVERLGLEELYKNNQWIVTLSNGQTRRARIARGLLKNPRILLADEPFLGLDPTATASLSQLLNELAPSPHVILGLRTHEPIPEWITHVAVIEESGIVDAGTKEEVAGTLKRLTESRNSIVIKNLFDFDKYNLRAPTRQDSKSILHLDNITVQYQDRVVINDLNWNIKFGDKWHLRGNNGTGKSTLLSLITADHPQSWNFKVKMFDEPRKVGKQNYFAINKTIGHASPEIHAIFPRNLTAFQAVSTGFTIGSFLPPNSFSHVAGNLSKEERAELVDSLLSYFEVDPAAKFSDLILNDQKVVLFLRSIVKNPELLILDEAFSGMNDKNILLCKKFVDEWGGTVIAIGHVSDEIPRCEKFIQLKGGRIPAEQGIIL
ncbi:P-loop containing nucleoside triphosphate hydrolase protein [Lipomyces japonicus]|uniref:P-loop containing nucleoside triphosphate hydrolase protein n=1 Tax=Lipomyces japonicus TaxID=56871 RepID=UPI0034CF3160